MTTKTAWLPVPFSYVPIYAVLGATAGKSEKGRAVVLVVSRQGVGDQNRRGEKTTTGTKLSARIGLDWFVVMPAPSPTRKPDWVSGLGH